MVLLLLSLLSIFCTGTYSDNTFRYFTTTPVFLGLGAFGMDCEVPGYLSSSLALGHGLVLLSGLPGGLPHQALKPFHVLPPGTTLCIALVIPQPTTIPVALYNSTSGLSQTLDLPATTFVNATLIHLPLLNATSLLVNAAPPDSFIVRATALEDPLLEAPIHLTLRTMMPLVGMGASSTTTTTIYSGSFSSSAFGVSYPVGTTVGLFADVFFRSWGWQLIGVPGGFPMMERGSDSEPLGLFTRPVFSPTLLIGPTLRVPPVPLLPPYPSEGEGGRKGTRGEDNRPLPLCLTAQSATQGAWTRHTQGLGPDSAGLFWAPSNCSLQTYTRGSGRACLTRFKRVQFVGDSHIRRLFKTMAGYSGSSSLEGEQGEQEGEGEQGKGDSPSSPSSFSSPVSLPNASSPHSSWCAHRRAHDNCVCEDLAEELRGYGTPYVTPFGPKPTAMNLHFQFGVLSGIDAPLTAPYNNYGWLLNKAEDVQEAEVVVFDLVNWDLLDSWPHFPRYLERVALLGTALAEGVPAHARLLWLTPIWAVRGAAFHNATFWLPLGQSFLYYRETLRVLQGVLGGRLEVLDAWGMGEVGGKAASEARMGRCKSGHLDSLGVEILAQILLNVLCNGRGAEVGE